MSMSTENIETKIEVALDQLIRVREDIKNLDKKIDDSNVKFVTKEQLENKLDTLRAEVRPTLGGVSRVIDVVITAVIVGVLALIIK